MVLLAAEHWLVGSDKYRLQHSQTNIIACLCQYGEKGRKVVSLRQCGQTLRVRFQVSGYSWIRLVEYQWVIRSRIVIIRAIIRVLSLSSTNFVSIVTLSPCTTSDEQWSEKLLLTTQFCVVFKILICLPTSNLFKNMIQARCGPTKVPVQGWPRAD